MKEQKKFGYGDILNLSYLIEIVSINSNSSRIRTKKVLEEAFKSIKLMTIKDGKTIRIKNFGSFKSKVSSLSKSGKPTLFFRNPKK